MSLENDQKYNLSFVAGTAMVNETLAVAEAYLQCSKDWKATYEMVERENLMEKEKVSTIRRVFALVKQRLQTLTDDELELLVSGNPATRRLIVILGIAKAHTFIFDFLSEQVRERFYGLHEKISHADFNEFYNEKRYVHPELESITDKTLAKVRQCIFRMLQQTELIDSIQNGAIQRPYLPANVEQAIVRDDSRLLAAYLYSNNEISNVRCLYE